MNNIYNIFKINAFRMPDKIAITFNGQNVSYLKLYMALENYNLQLPANSHVAIFLENSIQYVEWLLLASKYNLTLFPFPKDFQPDFDKFDIDYTVYEAGIKQIKKKNDIRDKNDGYIIVSTSGSTSEPKPIVLTEEIKLSRIASAKEIYNLDENDVILISTPMHHSLAQRGVLIPLILGATAVLMEKFKINDYLSLIESEKVTFNFAVSTQLELVAPHIEKYDVSSIKNIVSSSYSIKSEIKNKLLHIFNLNECYGTSEMGCISNLASDVMSYKYDTVGSALNGVEIKIINGEIVAKSPWRFQEYFNLPEITEASFTNNGFFKTGDFGSIDDDGFLSYKGRIKEMIKTGGISVYPIDIEKPLMQLNGVKEVAVIGVPDSYFGEAVIAIVVGDISVKELQKGVVDLASYQKPLFYDIVKELPKNLLGKLQKFKLQEKYKNLNIGKRLNFR